jgi:hypothetical protein
VLGAVLSVNIVRFWRKPVLAGANNSCGEIALGQNLEFWSARG